MQARRARRRALLVRIAVLVGGSGLAWAPSAWAQDAPPEPVGSARAAPLATADAVPYVGSFAVQCTMGNPSPGGVCDHHHSYTGAVDLGLPTGTTVRAAGPGKVVAVNNTCANGDSGCEGGAGRWVGVEHPDGKVSRYMHLTSASVSVGADVERGTVLGTSGTTGNAVVPHLHYDEQKPLFTRSVLGTMLACHGSSLVAYPAALGYEEWEDVPYGAIIRNDGYGCMGDLFVDVPADHAFFTEINWLVDEGLTSGYDDGTFRPETAVTRQAMSAWLHRRVGSPPGPFPDPGLADVPSGHAFDLEIWWMVATGRSGAYVDGTYRPAVCVSRQATAAFLYREHQSPPGPFPDPGFSDVGAGHPFATEIAWMVAEGIADGYPDGTFRPTTCVSRQAAAAFLYRME
jgi:hypothetical protein